MDIEIPQYCRRCGTMLIDGVCPTCPVHALAPAPQPVRPAHTAHQPTASAVTSVPYTATVPHAPAPPVAPAGQQHPAQPEPPKPWFSSVPTPPVAKRGMGWRYVHQWNWGAFLLCPLWLMNHGRIWRGIVCIALCVIPLGWVVALGMAIVYGIKGNRVASISRDFVDDAQFAAVQNAWRNFGFGIALLSVLLVLVAGYAYSISGLPRGA